MLELYSKDVKDCLGTRLRQVVVAFAVVMALTYARTQPDLFSTSPSIASAQLAGELCGATHF
jgi:hypothetical protein